jgi:manganese/zinc/iron transport system permease protein
VSPREIETLLIVVVAAMACALPGVFLVLRRQALLSDAIGHAILLGIVLAFLLVPDLNSPVLIVGAALSGLATVGLVELLHRTRLVREDAAIGLVFPVLFSLGVIVISGWMRSVHLDANCVLMGQPEWAAVARLHVGDRTWGPKALWALGIVLFLNLAFITVFYKELKLATFDAALAATLGFAPARLHYSLMALVSLTAVVAFQAVGSILVVALMITPPATAYLLTDRLSRMLVWSVALAALSSAGGYALALAGDASTSGFVAAAAGGLFVLALVFAPGRGLLAVARRRWRQRWEFAETMLAIHLLNHEGKPEAESESRVDGLHAHLQWAQPFVARVVRRAERDGVVALEQGRLELTEAGRVRARAALLE